MLLCMQNRAATHLVPGKIMLTLIPCCFDTYPAVLFRIWIQSLGTHPLLRLHMLNNSTDLQWQYRAAYFIAVAENINGNLRLQLFFWYTHTQLGHVPSHSILQVNLAFGSRWQICLLHPHANMFWSLLDLTTCGACSKVCFWNLF